MNEKELIEKRNDLQAKMEGILNKAKIENREMNDEEIKNFDDTEKEIKNIDATLERMAKMNKMENKKVEDKKELTEEEKDIKNFATFVLTLNVACVKNEFTELCIKIMNGTSSEKGNETFTFDFYVGDIHFENFEMKLYGVSLSTAVNNVPSLQFSFMV